MTQLRRGDRVTVALDFGEHAGTVQPGTFESYASRMASPGYAYVSVWCAAGGTRIRRVKVSHISTEERAVPIKTYEQICGADD